ncbi:TPA: hypothetical protein OUT26_001647 [Escherichia coli]|nr:hypothetical protein [Escherichia coli]
MNNFLTFHAEATPDGVNIMYRSNDGMTERVETVSYIDAVNRLDVGDYDDKPDEGMFIHLAIASGGNQGYFDYTSQHHVIMWRWLIATAFINEMRKENGTVSIIDDSGNHSVVSVYSNGIVAMPLYPVAERLAMANNIEGAMIEKYGVDVGTKNAIIFYSNMFDVEQGTLTSFGREVLADLHNSFIAELNENGIPEAPVTH